MIPGLSTLKRLRRERQHRAIMRKLAEQWHQISGPEQFALTPDSVVVCTPLWNARYWMPDWLAHHRALGVAGFAICDTGSQDGTLDYLSRQSDVALFSTALPFLYQNAMRGLLAERMARGSWALFADSDELFDYPGHGAVPIARLTAHLRAHGFSGLPGVMVDLFPQGPLEGRKEQTFGDEIREMAFYEWDSVTTCAYRNPALSFHRLLERNVPADETLQMHWGGVRRRVFDENACLTKTPLVKVDRGILPGVHPHCSGGPVHLADFHGVIRHYKFSNHLFQRDRATLTERRLSHDGDARRLEVIAGMDAVVLYSASARRYEGARAFLAAENFRLPAHLDALFGR